MAQGTGEVLMAVSCHLYGVAEAAMDSQNFFINAIIFTQLKSEFTRLHLLKFLCKPDHFPRRY